MLKHLTSVSLLSAVVLSGCSQTMDFAFPRTAEATKPATPAPQVKQPKNIIMVVADGMGPAFTSGYRFYRDDVDTPILEATVLDDILVGNASTHPHHDEGYVTDSAAAATALATGTKSYNGAIGVDANKQPVDSIMVQAKQKGMRTGLVVTSQINHATPAAYMVHNESRQNYDQIADDYFDRRVNNQFVADVMLGGGTQYFARDDRDLVRDFTQSGFQYVSSYGELATLPKVPHLLGLFAPKGLPAVLDDERPDRLAFMTKQAIKHLENKNGFFLLVEASQVDWAGHANDITYAMTEMHDFALTVEYLRDYVANNPDTLVVITADHSTGGLTLAADGEYRWSPEYIKGVKASLETIADGMLKQSCVSCYLEQQLGFTLTEPELTSVTAQADQKSRVTALKKVMDGRTNTGWTTSGHTALDVEVFAFGKGTQAFAGQLDNTDIAKRLRQVIDKVVIIPAVDMAATNTNNQTQDEVAPVHTMATLPEDGGNVLFVIGDDSKSEVVEDSTYVQAPRTDTTDAEANASSEKEEGGLLNFLFGGSDDSDDDTENSDTSDNANESSDDDEDECDFTTQNICGS